MAFATTPVEIEPFTVYADINTEIARAVVLEEIGIKIRVRREKSDTLIDYANRVAKRIEAPPIAIKEPIEPAKISLARRTAVFAIRAAVVGLLTGGALWF